MTASRTIKALIVALPTAFVLTRGDTGLGGTVLLGAGAALVAYAWIRLGARPAPARPNTPAANPDDEHRASAVAHCARSQHRIARAPTGRGPRDLRCPASRATARARRSTRR